MKIAVAKMCFYYDYFFIVAWLPQYVGGVGRRGRQSGKEEHCPTWLFPPEPSSLLQPSSHRLQGHSHR